MEKKQNKYSIYADNAATTKPCDDAIKAAQNAFENFGNPSSLHKYGRDARKIVEDARKTVAKNINAKPSEIIFTSGGTESVNLAILSAADIGEKSGKKHIITTAVEHHATLHTLDMLKQTRGFDISVLPVIANGMLDPEVLKAAIRPDTILFTTMYVNNEVGTIMPAEYYGEICCDNKIYYHLDATQAVGHIPLDVDELGCDLMSASAHKFHGIKGAGFLYADKGTKILPQILGGGQENGIRSGTENVPGIAAMAAAMDFVCENLDENEDRLVDVSEHIIDELSEIPHSHYNGEYIDRVPGIINFSFAGVEGEAMLIMLEQAGIYASAGSACNSKEIEPSHVLTAMGVDKTMAKSAVRFSLDASITDDEVEYLIKTAKDIVARLRAFSPTYHE